MNPSHPPPPQDPGSRRRKIFRYVGLALFILPYLLFTFPGLVLPAPGLITIAGFAIFAFLGFDIAANKFKFILAPVGMLLGLVISYFLAPGFVRMTILIGDWLTRGFEGGYSGTIVGCAVAGAALGILAGVFLDGRSPRRTL